MEIRQATASDFDQIWAILHETFKLGDTYTFSPDTTREEAYHLWMEMPLATYVALEYEHIVGTYFIKPNQPCLGAHVCNVGYVTAPKARRKGIGRLMCEHSLIIARTHGFKAMQYNFVVSTNQVAIELWKKCGFSIVGTLPNAFNQRGKGYVDAFVMYQWFS